MGKNNLIAILSQVGISLFSLAFYFILSEEVLILLLPAYLFAYYKVGTFLSKQENLLKDFISVSSVSIVGLFIWLGCVIYVATYTAGGGFIGPEMVWIFYVFYNIFSIIGGYIFSELIDSYPLMITSLFIINFIPPMIMVYGMKHSEKETGRKQTTGNLNEKAIKIKKIFFYLSNLLLSLPSIFVSLKIAGVAEINEWIIIVLWYVSQLVFTYFLFLRESSHKLLHILIGIIICLIGAYLSFWIFTAIVFYTPIGSKLNLLNQ